MGLATSVGPSICRGLKTMFSNDVACQGVSSPAYTAGLMDNVSIKGTSSSAIAEATKHYNTASTKCPNTLIVTGGYRYTVFQS
jgi:cutinase